MSCRILGLFSEPPASINPTRHLIGSALSAEPNVVAFHGSDHDRPTTVAGLQRRAGPFDAVVIDGKYFFKRERSAQNRWPEDLLECGLPMLVLNLRDHPHARSQEQAEERARLAKQVACVVLSAATGHQFWRHVSVEQAQREPWLDPEAYSLRHPEVIPENYVLLPHALAEHEFTECGRSRKVFDVSVLGAKYYFRERTIGELRKRRHLKIFTSYDPLQRALGNLASRSQLARRLYRRRFDWVIQRSVSSVTCAGTVGYPIRKFFEIPARSAVLIAEFFADKEALGFVHGENCFQISDGDIENVGALVDLLVSDSKLAERMASEGQAMVRELHTVRTRVRQIQELAEWLASGRLRTAVWEEGRLRPVWKDLREVAAAEGTGRQDRSFMWERKH